MTPPASTGPDNHLTTTYTPRDRIVVTLATITALRG
jgi:hypothetical protein